LPLHTPHARQASACLQRFLKVVPISEALPVPVPIQRGRLAAVSLAHAISDGFINFVAPLWFVVQIMFHLTDGQLGLLSLLLSLTTNLGQPLFGYVIDRWRLRNLIPWALLMACIFMSTVGFVPHLWLFTIFLILAGIGVAVFHPQGGALVAQASGSRRALGMSIFGAGGAIGVAGFALAAPLLHNLGLRLGLGPLQGFVFALPLGLVGVWLVWRNNPPLKGREEHLGRFSLRHHLAPVAMPVLVLFGVMVLRAGTVTAYATFIQVLQGKLGLPVLAQGGAMGIFVIGGALGNILGGTLCDRLGRRALTIVSLLACPPFLYFSVHCHFLAALGLLFIAGLLLRGAESVNIAQTQELLPEGVNTASAIAMGCTWGVAGFMAPLVGLISDRTGSLSLALGLSACLPVLAAILAIWLPPHRPTHCRPEEPS
jgi:MFS transporter, FSR family, fosmidomycin resistance protein